MGNWNGAAWAEKARQLSRGTDKRKLAAIHAGVAAGAALVITLLQYVLAAAIENTSGLSGMGMRGILQTAGSVLQIANIVLMPFWDLGFLFAALLWAREQYAGTDDLLTGFRRFGPYLRLMILRGLIGFMVGMVCAYISSFLYMMTPWAVPVVEFAQSVGMDMAVANEMMAQMDIATMDAMLNAMIPMLVIWGILCVAVLVPLLYRFRMAEFLLLEDRRMGALAALLLSARMLRKRCGKLFALDLRFWWYYGLQALCMLLYLSDLWLPMLGVTLPVDGQTAAIGLYIAYLAATFGIQALFRPRVATTYALAYEHLRQAAPVMPKVQEAPKNLPWDAQ